MVFLFRGVTLRTFLNPPEVFGEASGASRASEAVAAGDSAEEEPGGPSGAAFCGARGF